MAAAAPARAMPSGSSAASCRAIPPTGSTGGRAPSPTSSFIRETEWEAAQTVALWSDASRSMEWRSARAARSKRDRAELLRAALASLVLRGGERVRLIGGPAAQPCRARRADRAGESADRHPRLAARCRRSIRLPRHARAVLIGDFMAPLEQIHQAIAALAARPVRGHILQVLDPDEETLGEGNRAYAGRVLFEWAGGGSVLVPRVENVRSLYAERLRQHRAGVAAIAAAAGWGFLTHRTDQPAAQALLALWQALAPD